MATYCVQFDIETRYGLPELIELTDRTGSGVVDAVAVADAIDSASDIIDSYLRVRYQLPLVNTHIVLQNYCIDMAIYILWNLRRMGDIEDVRIRHNDAIEWLERVRDYKAELLDEVTTNRKIPVYVV